MRPAPTGVPWPRRPGYRRAVNRAVQKPSGPGYNVSVMDPSKMTAEEYLKLLANPRWYGEQDENGVDLSLIRENLRLTAHERLVKGDRGRHNALRLRAIGERSRANQRAGQPADVRQ